MKKHSTRKGSTPIKVWCLPEEREVIEANARAAGMSLSMFMRRAGAGCKIKGIIDCEMVLGLAKINGDQGRLGGLLKLWLTNDEKLGREDPEKMHRIIHEVLDRLVQTQIAMLAILQEVK